MALVDADLQFGDVCLVLQLEPRFTLVNAAHELHHLDGALLDSLLTDHPTGLKVMAAPLEPAFADDISTESLMTVVNLLREKYDYVVVDTASMLDELLLSLLERADVIMQVVDMDLPSVKNAKLALETLRLAQVPHEQGQADSQPLERQGSPRRKRDRGRTQDVDRRIHSFRCCGGRVDERRQPGG